MSRMDKVNELVYRELSQKIARDIEFPRDVFVTIVNVKVNPDLKDARVWISVLPEYKKMSVLKVLRKSTRELKNHLKQKTSLKYLPNLEFLFDPTESNASKLEAFIDSVS